MSITDNLISIFNIFVTNLPEIKISFNKYKTNLEDKEKLFFSIMKENLSDDIFSNFMQYYNSKKFRFINNEFELLKYVRRYFMLPYNLKENNNFLNLGIDIFNTFLKRHIANEDFILIQKAYLYEYLKQPEKADECIKKAVSISSNIDFLLKKIGKFYIHIAETNLDNYYLIRAKTVFKNVFNTNYRFLELVTNEIKTIEIFGNNEIVCAINSVENILKQNIFNFDNLSNQVIILCKKLDSIIKTNIDLKENIPLRDLQERCIKPLFNKISKLPRDSKEVIDLLKLQLDINEKLISLFPNDKYKLVGNLFNRIEYLRLHRELWEEYKFKDVILQAYKIGKAMYEESEKKSKFIDKHFGKYGEICRAMVEFKVCKPIEKRVLLLQSNEFLINGMEKDGEYIEKRIGRNYPRIALNYMELHQWEDAINYFNQVLNINKTKNIDRRIAFEARSNLGNCYLKLGLEAIKYDDDYQAKNYFKNSLEAYESAKELIDHESEEWFLQGTIADYFYLSKQYFPALSLYEKIMQRSINAPIKEKNLYDCFSYRWGQCLYKLGLIDKSIQQFKSTLGRNPAKTHRIKSDIWLLKLTSIKKQWTEHNKIKNKLYNDTELKNLKFHKISMNNLNIFLDTEDMRGYLINIDNRLLNGDYWAVISELDDMINFHIFLEGHEDVALLTKLGQAYMLVGNCELAKEKFFYVKELDQRPKNQSLILGCIGKVYLREGKYQNASLLFQKSYDIGADIAMFSLKAKAFTRLKKYDEAIKTYNDMLESNNDNKPWITRTGIAKAYYSKFLEAKADDDLEKAVYTIASVIAEYPNDFRACNFLVKMANTTIALNSLIDFILKKDVNITQNIFKAISKEKLYLERIISACLKSLKMKKEDSKQYWSFVLVTVDFLMEVTLYFYFFKDKKSFNKIIHDIFSTFLTLNNKRDIIREYLCAKKGLYFDYIEESYAKQIKSVANMLNSVNQYNMEFILNNDIIPRINRFIKSESLLELNILSQNYNKKEPEGAELKQILLKQFWGNDDLEKEGKYILNNTCNIQSNINISYPSLYLLNRLVDWFYPYPNGLWKEIIYNQSSWKWTIEINHTIHEKHIELLFLGKIKTNKANNELSLCFHKIKEKHKTCPIPRMLWFDYKFDEKSATDDKTSYDISVQIKLLRCNQFDHSLNNFNNFLKYMTNSYKKGISGQFEPNEFRIKADEYFPNDLDTVNIEDWIHLIHTYLDWHFSLTFENVINNKIYIDTIHNCVKAPLLQIGLNTENEVLDYLIKLDRLSFELGHIRKRTLKNISGNVSTQKLNIVNILESEIQNLSDANKDIIFEINARECPLLSGDEILLNRIFASIFSNSIWAVRQVNQEKRYIDTYIFEQCNNIIIRIENSFLSNFSDNPLSTKKGINSARNFIEKEFGGALKSYSDININIFVTELVFPTN